MKKMYDILLSMKDRFSVNDWLMMVKQAYNKEKITTDEMNMLNEMIEEKIED